MHTNRLSYTHPNSNRHAGHWPVPASSNPLIYQLPTAVRINIFINRIFHIHWINRGPCAFCIPPATTPIVCYAELVVGAFTLIANVLHRLNSR